MLANLTHKKQGFTNRRIWKKTKLKVARFETVFCIFFLTNTLSVIAHFVQLAIWTYNTISIPKQQRNSSFILYIISDKLPRI